MSDSGVVDYVDKDSLMNDSPDDHPSNTGENTLMDVCEDSTILFPLESAPIDVENHVQTYKEGSVILITPNEDLLRVLDSTITRESGELETLDSGKTIEVCEGPESSDSQLLMETSTPKIFEEVPLHQDASSVEVNLNISHPLYVGILIIDPTLSKTLPTSEGMAHDKSKGEVKRENTLEGIVR